MGLVGEELYKHHKRLFELDSMTILYVAMTRAKKELHIFSKNSSQLKSISYSSLFMSYCKNLKFNNKGEFEWGKNEKNKDCNKDISQDFNLDIDSNLNWKKNIYFDLNKKGSENQRKKGLLIHEALSQINSVDEIDFVIDNYREKKLFDISNHNKIKKLFSNQYKILNEKEILNPSGKILRPDKIVFANNKIVIIDFKTGKLRENDAVQLKEYEESMKKMNYKNIEKILVYVNDSIDIKTL